MLDQYNAQQLITAASRQLTGIDSAVLDAELLLAEILGVNRSKFYSRPDMSVDAKDIEKFWNMINQRKQGEPVAYLLGKKEFWSMSFTVNRYVLVPRPETECLVETALKQTKSLNSPRILDLGTGSGVIAIALASELQNASIVAVDISQDALNVAIENTRNFKTTNIEFLQSNWFEKVGGKFDVIVSNPPYVANDDEHLNDVQLMREPDLALNGGYQGLESIKKIIAGSVDYLTSQGMLFIEHGYNQGENIRQLLNDHFSGINTVQDYSGQDRVTWGNKQ